MATSGRSSTPETPGAQKTASPEPAPPAAPAQQFILEGVFHQAAKLGFLAWILAWILSKTPNTFLFNIPLALLAVGGMHWLSQQLDVRMRAAPGDGTLRRRRYCSPSSSSAAPAPSAAHSIGHRRGTASHLQPRKHDDATWRQMVNAPVVEAALEKLISNVVQEFIYDAFWNRLTPDIDFAAEVRSLLNTIIGNLSARARRVDTRALLLRDMTDLVIETLELYRDTRDSVGASDLEQMTPLARDRALRLEMRAEGNLHPALFGNEAHYEVLKKLSDGALALLVDPRDYGRPIVSSVLREVFAGAVLKPFMQFLMPNYLNRTLVMLLESEYQQLSPSEEVVKLEGEQQYEQRAAASALQEAEDSVTKQRISGKGQQAKLGAKKLKPVPVEVSSSASVTSSSQQQQKQQQRQKDGDPHKGGGGPAADPGADSSEDPRTAGGASSSPEEKGEKGKAAAPPAASSSSSSAAVSAGRAEGPAQHEPKTLPTAPQQQTMQRGTSREAAAAEGGSGAGHSAETATQQEQQKTSSGSLQQPQGPQGDGGSNRGSSKPPQQTALSGNPPRLGRKRLERTATSFQGQPVTKVVAAEICAERRSKEYVVFNIRVQDAVAEWTVLRRFRNFEQLHKRLRNVHGFAGSLPAKRFFGTNTWSFVEERREALDAYLGQVVAHKALGRADEVFEFLNPWSSSYALDSDVSLLNVVSSNLDNARHSVAKSVHLGPSKAATDKLVTEAATSRPPSPGLSDPSFRAEGPDETSALRSSKSAQVDDRQQAARRVSAGGAQARTLPRSSSDGELRNNHGVSDAADPSAPSTAVPAALSKWVQDPSQKLKEAPPHSADSSPRGLPTSASASSLPPSGKPPQPPTNNGSDFVSVPASAAAVPSGSGSSSSRPAPALDASLEEDSIGISRPLYLLVDAVFELQSHGFIWRQVTVVVKQMLSLVAGGTLDLFIAQKLHDLCSSHNIARLVLRARNVMWPGGVWLTTARARDLVAQGKQPPPSSVPEGGFRKNNWLMLDQEMGPDEAAMAKRLKDIFFKKAHPTLVRVVGRTRYTNAMQDVYSILQSPTYMAQLGHGILEIFLIHLMPELIPLLEDVRTAPSSAR